LVLMLRGHPGDLRSREIAHGTQADSEDARRDPAAACGTLEVTGCPGGTSDVRCLPVYDAQDGHPRGLRPLSDGKSLRRCGTSADYPLHSLLGKLFTLLPVGSVAFRVHLLSALSASLTCAAVFWIARSLIGRSAPSWAAGLGLSNHWPLIQLWVPGLLLLLWPRRHLILRKLHLVLPLTLVGLLPYGYLWARSLTEPFISFYGPLKGLDDLLFFVSRKGYSELGASSTASWLDQAQFAGFLLQQSWVQFTAAGSGLAILGCWYQWRRWSTGVSLALVLAFDFELLQRSVMRVYPLVTYGVMALWIGLAVDAGTDFLARRIRRGW